MNEKNFVKNDSGFTCVHCGHIVPKLRYSSRDHCNRCLYSLHVDIMPGDRKNDCGGVLRPCGVEQRGSRGTYIIYKCEKCGAVKKNKMAHDDDMDAVIAVSVQQK